MLGIDGKILNRPPKKQVLTAVLKNWERSAVKHFIEKPILLNLLDLSAIFVQGCCSLMKIRPTNLFLATNIKSILKSFNLK